MVFNWCEGVLVNLKEQINREKFGQLKKFWYGSIIVSFGLESVPLL